MKLNINSPAYYTNVHGIDNEIYQLCRNISLFVIDKEYSDTIDTVGIVPIIAPKEELEKGLWKELKKFDLKCRLAYVSKQINYESYVKTDLAGKKS